MILSVVSYDIMGQYSTWQCVELLLSHLPLLNVVFTLLFGAFKKALAAGGSSSSRLTLGAGGAPIKTRSERDDQMVQQLMNSMSEKISTPHVKPPTTDEESNEERGSPSTSSTVSSSGVVGAEYVIYTDEELTSGK